MGDYSGADSGQETSSWISSSPTTSDGSTSIEEEEHQRRWPSMTGMLSMAMLWRKPIPGTWIFPDSNKGDVTMDYELGGLVGKGQFGVVCLCTDRATGRRYACKTILRENLCTEEGINIVRNEVLIMEAVQHHPNVIKLRGVYEDKHSISLIMDFCSGGTVTDYIVKKGRYSEREAARLMRDIVNVVKHCHDHHVMHRDIKLTNFLLADEAEDSPVIAIDFGVSCFFTPGEKLTKMEGSPFYIAPEVLKESYGPECDIWSAGICLFILLSGEAPFNGGTVLTTLKLIQEAKLAFNKDPWNVISAGAKDLISSMLTINPAKRPTVHQILEHPWMKANYELDVPLESFVVSRLRHLSALSKLQQMMVTVPCLHLAITEETEIMCKAGQQRSCFSRRHECICEALAKRSPRRDSLGQRAVKAIEQENDPSTLSHSKEMWQADVNMERTMEFYEFTVAMLKMSEEEREMHLNKLFGRLEQDKDEWFPQVEKLCRDHRVASNPMLNQMPLRGA